MHKKSRWKKFEFEFLRLNTDANFVLHLITTDISRQKTSLPHSVSKTISFLIDRFFSSSCRIPLQYFFLSFRWKYLESLRVYLMMVACKINAFLCLGNFILWFLHHVDKYFHQFCYFPLGDQPKQFFRSSHGGKVFRALWSKQGWIFSLTFPFLTTKNVTFHFW